LLWPIRQTSLDILIQFIKRANYLKFRKLIEESMMQFNCFGKYNSENKVIFYFIRLPQWQTTRVTLLGDAIHSGCNSEIGICA